MWQSGNSILSVSLFLFYIFLFSLSLFIISALFLSLSLFSGLSLPLSLSLFFSLNEKGVPKYLVAIFKSSTTLHKSLHKIPTEKKKALNQQLPPASPSPPVNESEILLPTHKTFTNLDNDQKKIMRTFFFAREA